MKKILVIVLIFLVLAIIPITLYLVRQGHETRTKAAPATVLSFTPPSLNVSSGEQFDVFVSVDTSQNLALGVDLKISYDPQILEALVVEDAGFFSDPQILVNKIDNTSGLISFSIGSFSGRQGSGNIARISFKAKKAGASPLLFAQGTTAAGVDEFDILQRTTSATVAVSGSDGAQNNNGIGGLPDVSSPSPTPTVVFASSLTPTATASPTITPTSTPVLDSGAEEIPVTGISLPTIMFLTIGFLMLLFVFVLV